MLPVSFRFLHEPHTEQEVVCLFMLLLDEVVDQHGKGFDQPVIIEKIRAAFPDCIIRSGGRRIRIEFEHFGSDFKHNQEACDMVVCWMDDHGNWRDGLRVVELASVLGARAGGLFVSVDNPYPKPWTEESFFRVAEKYLESADDAQVRVLDLKVAREIVQLATEHDFGPHWPRSKRPVFTVGGRCQFFKVRADGEFRLSLRGVPPIICPELFDRLLKVVPAIRIDPRPASKRHGGHLSAVLDDEAKIRGFFDVWKWLDSVR